MDKTKLTLMMLPLVAVFMIPSAFALESGNTYFLDDSEFVSILIDVDSSGVATFEEVFITPEGDVGEFVMDTDSAKIVRISDDNSHGLIFGKTFSGNTALVIFDIEGDEVKLMAKVWTDNGKERIVSNGEVISLF